jgi:hypothetical protein
MATDREVEVYRLRNVYSGKAELRLFTRRGIRSAMSNRYSCFGQDIRRGQSRVERAVVKEWVDVTEDFVG